MGTFKMRMGVGRIVDGHELRQRGITQPRPIAEVAKLPSERPYKSVQSRLDQEKLPNLAENDGCCTEQRDVKCSANRAK